MENQIALIFQYFFGTLTITIIALSILVPLVLSIRTAIKERTIFFETAPMSRWFYLLFSLAIISYTFYEIARNPEFYQWAILEGLCIMGVFAAFIGLNLFWVYVTQGKYAVRDFFQWKKKSRR